MTDNFRSATPELYERQLQLEDDMRTMGIQRYRKDNPLPWQDRTASEKDLTDQTPGARLMNKLIGPSIEQYREEMEKFKAKRSGRKAIAMSLLVDAIEPEAAIYIGVRTLINGASQQSTHVRVLLSLGNLIKSHIEFLRLKKANKWMAKAAEEKANQSTSDTYSSKMVAGYLRRAADEYELELLDWSDEDICNVGQKIVDIIMQATGCFTVTRARQAGEKFPRVYFGLTEEVEQWLQDQNAQCEVLTPFRLPMIHPPKRWTTIDDGGYLLKANRVPLVKTRNKAYMEELAHLDMPEVYEAVNRIQSTPYRINQPVLDVIKVIWSEGGDIGCMPRRENYPLPPRPDNIDEDEEVLKEWKMESSAVHSLNGKLKSKRLQVNQKIWLADRFSDEEAIYFPHNVDFRGRVYPIPSILHPQGDDIGKALLSFAKGEPLGERGVFWLAVHIANLFGVDKVSLEDRVQWVHDNEAMLLDSGNNPLDGEQFWAMADDPWCALAACMEWAGYRREGEGYVSSIPVHMDGTCSGLQHFSAMLRDETGGRSVNLLPADKPQDFYTDVANRVEELIKESDEPVARLWEGKVSRKIAKRPCMTYCYAATRYGMEDMILSTLNGLRNEDGTPYLPNDVIPTVDAARFLSHLMFQAIGECVTAAEGAMSWLKAAAKVVASQDLPIHWTTPTGFPVMQAYKNFSSHRFNIYINGKRQKVTLAREGSKINKTKQVSSISPNFVHGCDAAHLMKTINGAKRRRIEVAVIHDSFGTHAGKVDTLHEVLRETFIEQYSDDILENIREEILEQLPEDLHGSIPPLPPKGTMDINTVRDSLFIFS